MRFSYKFNNLLGAVYTAGDLIFTEDGNSLISPVGNRITIYDLKNNKSVTLPTESRFNYTALDVSPNGCLLVAINEAGEAHIISLISHTIIYRYMFKRKVNCVKFSPNGRYIAVCKENNVFIFTAPGQFNGGYNEFVMQKVIHSAMDETTCLAWSDDSKILAVGARDNLVRLFSIEKGTIFNSYTLGSHADSIVGCYFETKSYDCNTISRNGQTCIWECSVTDIEADETFVAKKRARKAAEESEDDIDPKQAIEGKEKELIEAMDNVTITEDDAEPNKKFYYKRLAIHYLGDEARKGNPDVKLTSAAYNATARLFVVGFSSGAFFIYEMPEMNQIHSLSISEQEITSIRLNNTGDWIALGCAERGQLLVWEWQSETYVMKQQGHATNMTCVAFAYDGQHVASGGDDGKIKIWNLQSGFCVVTFSEHTQLITDLKYCPLKKIIVSSSLDGTVRGFDLQRYRNFRTMTSPRPIQFGCVAVDSSGDLVAAGGQDMFEIYLWNFRTGKLLEILSGHEGPICSLVFSPLASSTSLASVSWDSTLKVWDALERGSAHESISLLADGLCVVFKPNGLEVAVATLNGQITVFEVKTAREIASIDGRNDLGTGVLDSDLVVAKQTLKAKSFTSLCYSADGEYLLAGGQSKNVCIYNVKEAILVKKFEITQNRSFHGVDDFINRRKMTQYGNLALIEMREESEGGPVQLKLPGVKRGDLSARTIQLEIRVFDLKFSPTGEQFAAATTEGLLVYGLKNVVLFDPWELQLNVTPKAVRDAINKTDYSNALMMAMKLNEAYLITEIMETIPPNDVELILANLHEKYVERLLVIIATSLDASPHLEFYLNWAQHLLTLHGNRVRHQRNLPGLVSLQKSIAKKYEQISKLCDYNKYTMRYVAQMGMTKVKQEQQQDLDEVFMLTKYETLNCDDGGGDHDDDVAIENVF